MEHKNKNRKRRTVRFKTLEGGEKSGIVMHTVKQGHFVLLLPERRSIWQVPHRDIIRDRDDNKKPFNKPDSNVQKESNDTLPKQEEKVNE